MRWTGGLIYLYLLRLEVVGDGDIREALDELELVLDLAALVGALLLSTMAMSVSMYRVNPSYECTHASSWSALAPSLSETWFCQYTCLLV